MLKNKLPVLERLLVSLLQWLWTLRAKEKFRVNLRFEI